MMGVVFAACMLSGARANFMFAPLLYLTILFLDAKLKKIAVGLLFAPIVMGGTMEAVGLDVLGVFGATSGLAKSYGSELVIPELIKSILSHPFGEGVGSNTGQANNLISDLGGTLKHNIEGYYAKAAIELGFIGLMLVVMIFAALIFYGAGIRRQVRDPVGRSIASSILAFIIIMALHSGKGWQIELDPINVWFWLLVGLLFRVPHMDFSTLSDRRRKEEAMHRAPRRRRRLAPQPGVARIRPRA